MTMREFQQAIDGFQVLNAATKWIHDHTKTRLKNKLKVANGNEQLFAWECRPRTLDHMSDNSSPMRSMSQIVNRA